MGDDLSNHSILILRDGEKMVSRSIGGADAHIYARHWSQKDMIGIPKMLVEEDDQNRILRPFVHGENLSQILIERDLSPVHQGQFALSIMKTLESLSEVGLAHGAIKASNVIFCARTSQWVLVDPATHGDILQDLKDLAHTIDSYRTLFPDLRWRVWVEKVKNGELSDIVSAQSAIYALGLDQSLDLATPTPEGCSWIGAYQATVHRSLSKDVDQKAVHMMKKMKDEINADAEALNQAFDGANVAVAAEIATKWDELVMELLFKERTPEEAAKLLMEEYGSLSLQVENHWRPIDAIELQIAASVIAGEIDETTKQIYVDSIMNRQLVLTANHEREQFQKAHSAAQRVAELEEELTSLEGGHFWGRGFRERKEKLRRTKTRLALARDARDSLLSKILPSYRAIFDASELQKLVGARLSEKEQALQESMHKWLHFLPPVTEKIDRPISLPPLFKKKEYNLAGLTFEMMRIPGNAIDSNRHVEANWVALTPVTQEWMRKVCEENPSRFSGSNRPVDSVNWFEAIHFCNQLSLQFDLEPAYIIDKDGVAWMADADGFRLPTVDEWLHAAVAGQFFSFSGSSKADDVAWHWENANGQTHPVAQKLPNDWGLYDMCGNVGEWCWDKRLAGCGGHSEDHDERMLMGGSWYQDKAACQLNALDFGRAESRSDNVGFRLFRNALV